MLQVANRKIQKLQIWVEYRFIDADRRGSARVKVPINGASDLLKLEPTMASISTDLADGTLHSLHVEVTFEGGHSAYCEIGQVGGAFGGLAIALGETLGAS